MSIEAMKRWLECAERCESLDGNYSWADVVSAIKEAIEQAQKQERPQPDSICQEDDGCPTEKAVLQRFWRKHKQAEKQEPITWSGVDFDIKTTPPPRQPLSDEQCDEAIRRSGLWTLACTVPQNLAMLRGLCREAAHGIKGEA